jgi:hypothetical protein
LIHGILLLATLWRSVYFFRLKSTIRPAGSCAACFNLLWSCRVVWLQYWFQLTSSSLPLLICFTVCVCVSACLKARWASIVLVSIKWSSSACEFGSPRDGINYLLSLERAQWIKKHHNLLGIITTAIHLLWSTI